MGKEAGILRLWYGARTRGPASLVALLNETTLTRSLISSSDRVLSSRFLTEDKNTEVGGELLLLFDDPGIKLSYIFLLYLSLLTNAEHSHFRIVGDELCKFGEKCKRSSIGVRRVFEFKIYVSCA